MKEIHKRLFYEVADGKVDQNVLTDLTTVCKDSEGDKIVVVRLGSYCEVGEEVLIYEDLIPFVLVRKNLTGDPYVAKVHSDKIEWLKRLRLPEVTVFGQARKLNKSKRYKRLAGRNFSSSPPSERLEKIVKRIR